MSNTTKSKNDLRAEFKKGQTVVVDDNYYAKVVRQTPKRLFTTIESGGEQWNIMTYRLRELKDNELMQIL